MAEVAAKFTADISGYKSAMSKMASSTTSATKSVSSLGSKVSNAMKKVGKVTMGAGAATTAMGVSALKSYGTFQQSLNKAAVVAGGTSKDIGKLSDMANKMGAELPLSAQDAADAMVSMAQDGASIKKITKEFPAISEAATATGADLQTTAGTVQQAMNVWGKSLKSPAKAAAILTQTANLSNASVEDMSGAIANIGGVASQAKFGMGDMTESIGLLTNKGFTAQRASRDLSHAIIQMEAPSKGAKKQMNELGLSFTDAQGNMKPFPTILKEVAKATDGMSASQKTAALKTMFNTTGMQAMLPLLDSVNDKSGNTATSWDAYAKAQDGASSSTDTATKFLKDQASEMQKNVGSKIEQVGGNWESLRNKSMASKSAITGGMVDMINNTLTWSSESNSGIAKVIRSFVGLSPVIGPAVTATGYFILYAGQIGGVAKSAAKGIARLGTSAVKSLARLGTSAVSAAGRLFGAGKAANTTNSSLAPMAKTTKRSASAAGASATNFLKMGAAVALVGAGVLAASAGIAILVQSAINLANAGSDAQTVMGELAVGVVAVAGAFALLGPALTANAVGIGVFGAAVLAIGAGVAAFGLGINQLSQAIVMLSGHMNDIVPVMANLGTGFAAMLTSFLNGLVTATPQLAASFISIFTGFATTIATHAPQLMASFVNIFTSFTTAVITNAPKIAAQITAMMLSLMTAIATNAPKLIAGFTSMMVSLLGALAANAPKLVGAFAKMIVSFVNTLAKNAPKIIASLTNLLVNMLNAIAAKAPSIIAAFSKMIVSSLKAITKQMPKFIKAGADFIVSILKGIANNIGKIVSAAVDVVVKFIKGIANNLSKIINAGVKLIGKFINGMVSAIPKIVDIAVKAVMKFVYGVGYALGKVMGSGHKLINQFIRGVKSGLSSAHSAGQSAGNAVKTGVSLTDLFSNGSSIMSSFLNGLKSSWQGVKSFVGGIASWIRKHKGPISYDAKLLIPAGNAIMNGLNSGLMNSFSTVQRNVSGMADKLSDSINSVAGDIKTGDLSMQAASYQGGSIDQNIDTDNWVKPTYVVHNELVGDKIRTIVSQGEADDQVSSKFFMS